MPRELVTVATFATAAEASPARARLEEEGIRTYLEGGVTSDLLSYFGTAVTGVALRVAAGDVERALQCFGDEPGSRQGESEPIEAWTCARCDTQIDDGFEVCWSCGTTVDESAALDAGGATALPVEPDRAEGLETVPCPMCGAELAPGLATCPRCGETLAFDEAAEAVNAGSQTDDEDLPDEVHEAERILVRAYRASILGIALLPPVLNVYSALRLAEYNRRRVEYDGRLGWRYVVAWLVNAVVIAGGTLLWIEALTWRGH